MDFYQRHLGGAKESLAVLGELTEPVFSHL